MIHFHKACRLLCGIGLWIGNTIISVHLSFIEVAAPLQR